MPNAGSKIIDGLVGALLAARCEHKMFVTGIREMLDGRARVTSRCDHCGCITTEWLPRGQVEFVTVARE